MPPDYVFPFQSEAIDVLRSAIAANPRDARAPYYLGNLLYDWQPEEATQLWESSASLDPSFAITHRNLATAYMHQASGADITKAITELEKAVSLDHKYALHFTELDELYEEAGTPLEKRVTLFQQNASVVAQRDDALNRYVALQVAAGQLDDAIQTMSTHTFAVAEGENLNVVEHWTEAHILRAQTEIQTRRYRDALKNLEAAATIPANLPIGIGFDIANAHQPEIAYWSGVAYAGSGNKKLAEESWKQAVAQPGPTPARRPGRSRDAASGKAQDYYRGLAFQKLGQEDKAQELFRGLVQFGQNELQSPAPTPGASGFYPERRISPRARSANTHYIAGLGYMGLNDQAAAKAELNQAVQLNPGMASAINALSRLP